MQATGEQDTIKTLPSKAVQIESTYMGEGFTDVYALCEDGSIWVRRSCDKGGVRIHSNQGWVAVEPASESATDSAPKRRGRPRKEETAATSSTTGQSSGE